MPTVTQTIETEIEVYCQTCGEGLCNYTESTEGRTRHVPQFRVEVCWKCIEEKEEIIKDLEKEKEWLADENEGLKREVSDLESYVKRLEEQLVST